MRALLIGSGGREHALAWALARSPDISELVSAPGNPGMRELGATEPLDVTDLRAAVALARRLDAGLVVVGPEAPLVAGAGDALRADGRAVFGPDAAAARIEGSKAFAKDVMAAAGVATARWRTVRSATAGLSALDELGRQVLTHHPTDSVGTEITPSHGGGAYPCGGVSPSIPPSAPACDT